MLHSSDAFDSGAAMRIMVSAGELLISTPSETIGPVTFDADRGDQREKLNADLLEFRNPLCKSVKVSQEVAAAALRLLHERGRHMLYNIFRNDMTLLKRVSRLLKDACNWGQSNSARPAIVEVIGDVKLAPPIELLPLFDPRADAAVGDLKLIARSFVGFSAIVRRVIPGAEVSSSLYLTAAGKLPVRFFWNETIWGAHSLKQYFMGDRIELDGDPWPTGSISSADFAKRLANAILEPSSAQAIGRRQVSHFMCHCDTSKPSSEDYTLGFRGHTVTYKQLQDALNQIDLALEQVPKRRPLVFLNACGTSNVSPGKVSSFPELFLQKRHQGFIGTETRISDEFSVVFTRLFYQNLLDRMTLGEALHEARWMALEGYSNPLGIVYSLHGNPNLRVPI